MMLSGLYRTWSFELGVFESDWMPYGQVPFFRNKSNMRRKIIRGVGALQQGILWINYLSNFVDDAFWIVQNLVIWIGGVLE